MRNGVTFDHTGQPIRAGFHIPQNLANFPYVPHPAQLAGMIPNMNAALGSLPMAGHGAAVAAMVRFNPLPARIK